MNAIHLRLPTARIFPLVLLVLLGAMVSAKAQLIVDLKMKNRQTILHEPIIATVSITNNTGRNIVLADTAEGGQWFAFQIRPDANKVIPARNVNYEVPPLQMAPGETVKRSVNLNELYMMDDYGTYRVQAAVYFAPLGKFFTTRSAVLDVTEGTVIWQQTAGIPDDGDGSSGYRTFSLLSFPRDRYIDLYVRIAGKDDGITYGCYKIGHLISGFKPLVQFDRKNDLWIMSLTGQKTYLLTHIGVNGTYEGQSTYVTPKSIPRFRQQADGSVQIVGAYRQEEAAENPAGVSKLSDRPPGLPK